MDKQIKKDIKNGLALDPAMMNQLSAMEQENAAFQPEIDSMEADAANEREIEKMKAAPKPPAAAPKNNTAK